MANPVITPSSEQFSKLDGNVLIDIPSTGAVIGKGRNSIYRLFQSGQLTPIKVGSSTRIRVSEIRKLIGAV